MLIRRLLLSACLALPLAIARAAAQPNPSAARPSPAPMRFQWASLGGAGVWSNSFIAAEGRITADTASEFERFIARAEAQAGYRLRNLVVDLAQPGRQPDRGYGAGTGVPPPRGERRLVCNGRRWQMHMVGLPSVHLAIRLMPTGSAGNQRQRRPEREWRPPMPRTHPARAAFLLSG